MTTDFLHRHRTGVLLVFYLSLSLLCMTLRIEPYVVGIKTAAWYLVSPQIVYSGAFFSKLDSLKGRLFRLVRVEGENHILREQNVRLAQREIEKEALEEENNRLRELLILKQRRFPQAIAAEVIGRDVREWFQSVVIDKGSRDNVVFSAAVMTPLTDRPSLVGRIIEVNETTSKVLLLTDAISAVSVMVVGKGDIALLEGRDTALLSLNYLASTSDVASGDQVVTAGLGSVFPPGIPVGHIERVEVTPDGFFKSAKVTPYAALNSLRSVLVLERKEVAP